MLDMLVKTAEDVIAGEQFSKQEKYEATAFLLAYRSFKNHVEGGSNET